MRRGILVTRPEPGLAETMQALSQLGWTPVAAPLLRIRPLPPAIPAGVRTVLLTSGQAAEPLARLAPWLLDRPVLSVGDATAARAIAAGFSHVDSVSGDADRLAARVLRDRDSVDGTLLLACGQGQGLALATRLRDAGFVVIRRCVYRAFPANALPKPALEAIGTGGLAAALFFSTETASTFVRIVPRRLHPRLADIRALAISARAAEPLRPLVWSGIEAAAEPTAASLLAMLDQGSPP